MSGAWMFPGRTTREERVATVLGPIILGCGHQMVRPIAEGCPWCESGRVLSHCKCPCVACEALHHVAVRRVALTEGDAAPTVPSTGSASVPA